LEAVDVAHDGRNTGSGNARILAVFMGADGVPNGDAERRCAVGAGTSVKIARLGNDARVARMSDARFARVLGPARMRILQA
jgi:hypothetical protein